MTQTDLPPTDHVARVLLKRGGRDAALMFLRAAVARDPGEMACAALLKAVEARPDSSVYGPDLALDLDLARAYARRGWLIEALALINGAGLLTAGRGRELSMELQEILGPVPDDASPELLEADLQIRRGGASVALMTFDELVATGRELPGWAERRRALLSSLLLDAAPVARPVAELQGVTPVGGALEERLAARDFLGALAAARAYAADHPNSYDAKAVVASLGRLVEAIAEIDAGVDAGAMRTQPMTGINVALFQTRMCNFDVAERMFRKLVIEDSMNDTARSYLDDVQVIRRALGVPVTASMNPPAAQAGQLPVNPASTAESTVNRRPPGRPAPGGGGDILEEPTRRVHEGEIDGHVRAAKEPPPAIPAEPLVPVTPDSLPQPDAFEESTRQVKIDIPATAKKPITSPNLLKKTGRPAADGWGTANAPPRETDWDEVSTEIGDPDQMAELMLKQGYAERALRIYERLEKVYPQRPKYARRAEEIRGLIAQDAVPALATHPGDDLLSRPDESASSVDWTIDDPGAAPADPRTPAAGAALDALAPQMDYLPDVPRSADVPATADHAHLLARQAAREEPPAEITQSARPRSSDGDQARAADAAESPLVRPGPAPDDVADFTLDETTTVSGDEALLVDVELPAETTAADEALLEEEDEEEPTVVTEGLPGAVAAAAPLEPASPRAPAAAVPTGNESVVVRRVISIF